MAYIVGTDRNQTRMITASLDDLIDKDNSVLVLIANIEIVVLHQNLEEQSKDGSMKVF